MNAAAPIVPDRTTRSILGVAVSPMRHEEAVAVADAACDAGRPLLIAFANANLVTLASEQPALLDALKVFLVLNDGVGMDVASKVLHGEGFPANLNGTDFVPAYLRESRRRHRVYLLGGQTHIVELAAKKLAADAPRQEIVGYRDGFFDAASEPLVLETIRQAKPDILLVALGNPKQELWLRTNFPMTGATLGFGVGALFDFLAGAVPRAPKWVQACRAEWLFRIAQEPGRLWKRYFVGGLVFAYRVGRAKMTGPARS